MASADSRRALVTWKAMANTSKMADLFRAIGSSDLELASSIAADVCRLEERKGHRASARRLRGALAGTGGSRDLQGRHLNGSFLTTALVKLPNNVSLDDVVLNEQTRVQFKHIVAEWTQKERLKAVGIRPRTKLLFHGPPGCGKSLSARALGKELGLPVFLVRFDAVIGSFLGQTATHLRQLFQFAETTPCILLLDELDALGKRRGNPLDVGELDRVVIALMQELEHSNPIGLVIGTSNLPLHLDDALWRRFDADIAFPLPKRSTLRRFAQDAASRRKFRLSKETLAKAASTKSFAAAESLVLAELRQRILR